MTQSLFQRQLTPLFRFDSSAVIRFVTFDLLCILHEPLGGILSSVEHSILHQIPHIGRDILIDYRLAGIHNSHVQAGSDGVIEKNGMHHLTHRLVAAKGEGEVAHPAAHLGVGQVLLDPANGVDIIHTIVAVLLDAGGYG